MRLRHPPLRDLAIGHRKKASAIPGRLVWLSITLFCANHIDAQTTDPRTPLPTHTRPWHEAIGHLQVPITRFEGGRRRHFTEHCSATSVTPGPHPIFVTAWHCLDGYDALLRPMLMTIGQREPVPMRVLASGGSMSADWALLRTDEPIEHLHWIPLSADPLHIGTKISAAGIASIEISSDQRARTPSTQRRLLIHAECEVTDAYSNNGISNCVARPGASGGAILSRTDSGSVRLSGVISAGDGESVVLYYPADALFRRVQSLR